MRPVQVAARLPLVSVRADVLRHTGGDGVRGGKVSFDDSSREHEAVIQVRASVCERERDHVRGSASSGPRPACLDGQSTARKKVIQVRARTQRYRVESEGDRVCTERQRAPHGDSRLDWNKNSKQCWQLSRARTRRTSRRWTSRGRTAPRATAAAVERDLRLTRTHLGFPRCATNRPNGSTRTRCGTQSCSARCACGESGERRKNSIDSARPISNHRVDVAIQYQRSSRA